MRPPGRDTAEIHGDNHNHRHRATQHDQGLHGISEDNRTQAALRSVNERDDTHHHTG